MESQTSERQDHLASLLMQHRTALYSYILSCVCRHADAEDILQTVLVAIIESGDSLQEKSEFLPWAFEVARRRILNHFSRSKRELPVDPGLIARLAEAAGRLEEAQPTSPYRTALLACLDRLPDPSRQVIKMRYDGSKSGVADVASKINRSVSATYSLIKRIKVILRECVERRLRTEEAP